VNKRGIARLPMLKPGNESPILISTVVI